MASETPNDRPARNDRGKLNYTAYDRAMIFAAQNELTVYMMLADGSQVTGKVVKVDKFHVEMEVVGKYHPYCEWFNKSMIVRTRIEK